jgi:hypothetical protein
VDIPSVCPQVNTGIQVLVREVRIVSVQQVDQFEFGSMCHLANDSPKGLFHAGHFYHQDFFNG